jgi:hypothetical protein
MEFVSGGFLLITIFLLLSKVLDVFPKNEKVKAVFYVNRLEEECKTIRLARTPNYGDGIEFIKYMSEEEFANKVSIFCDGFLLLNENTNIVEIDDMKNDVARIVSHHGIPEELCFYDLSKDSIIQVVVEK